MTKRGLTVCNLDTAGGIITPLQTKATWNGNPIAIVGCPVVPHPPCDDEPIHCSAVMAEGDPKVTINGIPVCFRGHVANCGHPATGRIKTFLMDGESDRIIDLDYMTLSTLGDEIESLSGDEVTDLAGNTLTPLGDELETI